MNIPNDTGQPYRLNKFIEYQHAVPPVDLSTLLAYARASKLSPERAVLLAFLHSATYCEVTAIFLLENLRWDRITISQLETFWNASKSHLIFNSSRRYVKNMNWFVPILEDGLKRSRRNWLSWAARFTTYALLREEIESVQFTGHFAGERFLKTLLWFSKADVVPFKLKEPEQLSWKVSSNETSGLLNILYRDEEADEFDRSGKLSKECEEKLNAMYLKLHDTILRRYPEQMRLHCAWYGKLCSWRNLFKGRRYGGYHHDRQLENLIKYRQAYPGNSLWDRLFKLRRQIYASQLLGELGGWSGIRKDRQKLWLCEGRTGVES